MAELYDVTAATSLTPIVESLTPKRTVNQITNFAIDGTSYVQIVGAASIQYDVVCYAPRNTVPLIELAYSRGNTMKVVMSHGTYYGIIISFSKSELPQQYFKMELTLAMVPTPETEQETEPESEPESP